MENNAEGGFTLLETLAAIAVVSLVMGILGLSLSSSAGALEKTRDRVLFGIRLLRADSLLRDRVGAVAIPYWETPILEAGDASLAIPWYQGERDGRLRLLTENGELILEAEDKWKKERLVLIAGLDGAELSVLRNEERAPCGIAVTYFHKQHSYRTLAAFSTAPLRGGRP
jgi:prepilin-type N-terminal cleavage/methylation domain-containing protein